MNELTTTFRIESPPAWLEIGYDAENNWRTITINCEYWFNIDSNGIVVLMYKPACSKPAYPLKTERSGNNIVWTPESAELVAGVGTMQAFFEVNGETIGASKKIPCEVDGSLLGSASGGTPPWAVDVIEEIKTLTGHYPYVADGKLYVWNSASEEWFEFALQDGYSPEVTITQIANGHRVTITDKLHPLGQSFDVMNGEQGERGIQGERGEDGTDGYSPSVTITNITGGHTVTITDAEHPQGQSFSVMNGQDGISEDVKVALLNCFEHVAWIDADGQTYYDALEAALYPPKTLVSISAVFTQGSAVIYDTDSLDTLRQYLTVTATYDDTSTGVVTNYTLSGTLTVGTSTITVSYGGKTTTFNVTVTKASLIPAEYQQVEWISANNDVSTLGAHIKTGIIPTTQTTLIARIASVGSQSVRNFAGIRDAQTGADKAFVIVSFRSAGKIGFMRWGASIQAINFDNDFHDYVLSPSESSVDGTDYPMPAPLSQTITREIYLFGEWDGFYYINNSNIKIASYTLKEDGQTVRDYVPCYRKSDNVIGMYDRVTGEFKTNDGSTGAFTKGADVA